MSYRTFEFRIGSRVRLSVEDADVADNLRKQLGENAFVGSTNFTVTEITDVPEELQEEVGGCTALRVKDEHGLDRGFFSSSHFEIVSPRERSSECV